MLGCVLGYGGYREESLIRLQQAMRASPHDPLTWLWTIWKGAIQLLSQDFDASIQTFQQLLRLRPGFNHAHVSFAICHAHLGRIDEARQALKRARQQFQDPRYQSAPWLRPEDSALRLEGIRLDPDDVQSNMVYLRVDGLGLSPAEFSERLLQHGVRINPYPVGRLRAVTHLDVSKDGIKRTIEAARIVAAEALGATAKSRG